MFRSESLRRRPSVLAVAIVAGLVGCSGASRDAPSSELLTTLSQAAPARTTGPRLSITRNYQRCYESGTDTSGIGRLACGEPPLVTQALVRLAARASQNVREPVS